jgi:hypothetical protein
MADTEAPRYPVIVVTDAGAMNGTVNIHDQSSGQTLSNVPVSDYLDTIRQMNQK